MSNTDESEWIASRIKAEITDAKKVVDGLKGEKRKIDRQLLAVQRKTVKQKATPRERS